jgi:hypothetical protein
MLESFFQLNQLGPDERQGFFQILVRDARAVAREDARLERWASERSRIQNGTEKILAEHGEMHRLQIYDRLKSLGIVSGDKKISSPFVKVAEQPKGSPKPSGRRSRRTVKRASS